MDLYAQLRAVDDQIQAGKLTLLDLYDMPLIRQVFSRFSRAQVHTATVRDRAHQEPPKPTPKKRVVPVRHRRKKRT